jgi:hypothetical protein
MVTLCGSEHVDDVSDVLAASVFTIDVCSVGKFRVDVARKTRGEEVKLVPHSGQWRQWTGNIVKWKKAPSPR